jgi:hypothetical protein
LTQILILLSPLLNDSKEDKYAEMGGTCIIAEYLEIMVIQGG